MSDGIEFYDVTDPPTGKAEPEAFVAIRETGYMYISKPVMEMLDDPDRVLMGFDHRHDQFVIANGNGNPKALSVYNKRHGSGRTSARGTLRQFGMTRLLETKLDAVQDNGYVRLVERE